MKEGVRDVFLFSITSIDFIEDKARYKDLPSIVHLKHQKAKDILRDSIKDMGLINRDCLKLARQIERGEIKFDTITRVSEKQSIKQMGKTQTKIKWRDLETIVEHAMEYKCRGCSRNPRKCTLRVALNNNNIPQIFEGGNKSKCGYSYEDDLGRVY